MHSSCGAPPAQEQYMASIPVGARGSFTLVVTAEHLANRFKDATLPPVLATPVMIMAMENAALNAIKPYLGAHESAVGTRVDVLHLAATPVGRQVVAGAKVTKVEVVASSSMSKRQMASRLLVPARMSEWSSLCCG